MSVPAIDVLRRWASLGASLNAIRPRLPVRWDAAKRMIAAAQVALEVKAIQLKALLELSQKRLEPLGEPLTVDLGLHRWLSGEREEAYSDWLQWVVAQLSRPDRVYRMFGQTPPDDWATWGCVLPEVRREVTVPVGHEGHGGRLDLVIRYHTRAVLVVEVKMTGADEADTGKHWGYYQWLLKQPEPDQRGALLVICAEKEDYDGFRPCRWADVCVALRQMVPKLDSISLLARAMILAFVAAVEQNLLGLSSSLIHQTQSSQRTLFNAFAHARIVDHLTRVVEPESLRRT